MDQRVASSTFSTSAFSRPVFTDTASTNCCLVMCSSVPAIAAPVGRVLRHMGSDVQAARSFDQRLRIVTTVSTQCQSLSCGLLLHHLHGGIPVRCPGGQSQACVHYQTIAILRPSIWPTFLWTLPATFSF